MAVHLPHQHLPNGLRRVEVALPPALVAELDSAIAIRRLLDQGGMELFPTYPDWP